MGVLQVAQRAEDLERAVAFYCSALGAERLASFTPPGIAFVRLGDLRVMFERSAPSVRLYVEVDDARAAIDQQRTAGVRIESEAHPIFADDDGLFGPAGTVEWQGFIRDSEDNLIGLVSRHAKDS